VTSFSDHGLSSTAAYTYRVRAINNGGASDWSNEASSYVVLPAPAAPTGLTAQAVTGDQMGLSWTDNSGDEFAFALWRKSGTGDYQRIAVLSPNVTSYSDRSLIPDVAYTYRVRAMNNGGASDWSDEASSFVLLPAPAAPTGLTA